MCRIIPYESSHRRGVLAVVQDVHREYNFSWDSEGYHRDLYEIESSYLENGGMFWVLADSGDAVAGCVGVTLHDRHRPAHDPQGSMPIERDSALKYAELHRLYLRKDSRGQGWGRRMLDEAVAHARANGCVRMIAWSDVVLKNAHALYLKYGFVQEGRRICADPDQSRESGFWRQPL